MIRVKECVRKMFGAFGRNPDDHEETVSTYVDMLVNFQPSAVAEAMLRLSLSSKRLPTVSDIVSACREQRFTESQAGAANINSHTQQVNLWYKQAINAGWSLPQRDELLELCDRLIDKSSGQWRAGGENQMRKDVAALAANVKLFHARQKAAAAAGDEPPDETLEDWGWAIPKEGEEDWDPAKESLWQFCLRPKTQKPKPDTAEQFAWNP
jgi:hypothetical protein